MKTRNIILPVVCNIKEAKEWAHSFNAVLTAGPNKREVQWGHKNHRVWEFGDTVFGVSAPKLDDIQEAVFWGAGEEDLLVHCHAGMSRSTAIAWGISIARGADPEDSFLSLKENHPIDGQWGKRDFIPNRLIVEHLQTIFELDDLLEIRNTHIHEGWFS